MFLRVLIIAIILLAVLGIAWIIFAGIQAPVEKDDLIRLTTPRPNQIVETPLIVEGEARGTWYFEASFPVVLKDSNGTVLGITPAQALREWMTTEYVPFKAILNFSTPATKEGELILEKDNPSGLPENANELRIPVKFKTVSAETTKVLVHFGKSEDNQMDCSKTVAVSREVLKTQAVARAALEELLKGPTESEKQTGIFTSINPGVKIQSLSIQDGVARVDFDDQLEFQVGGSCRVAAIRWQIVNTVKQFPTVKDVIISINGRTEDILQP